MAVVGLDQAELLGAEQLGSRGPVGDQVVMHVAEGVGAPLQTGPR